MSRIDTSVQELFLKLGGTPATRSARAESLFRRLRDEDARDIMKSLHKAPSANVIPAAKSQAPKTK
jgi:hypothetical protein